MYNLFKTIQETANDFNGPLIKEIVQKGIKQGTLELCSDGIIIHQSFYEKMPSELITNKKSLWLNFLVRYFFNKRSQ